MEAGHLDYLEGKRWLPDNRVTTIAPAPDGSVWVGTQKGLSHIYHRELTLAEKSEIVQKDLQARNRRYGFVTQMHLRAPGVLDGAVQEISDNDGLWTSLYIASQSYRFAATKSAEAKANAWRSMQALLRWKASQAFPASPRARFARRTNRNSRNAAWGLIRSGTHRLWNRAGFGKAKRRPTKSTAIILAGNFRGPRRQ